MINRLGEEELEKIIGQAYPGDYYLSTQEYYEFNYPYTPLEFNLLNIARVVVILSRIVWDIIEFLSYLPKSMIKKL